MAVVKKGRAELNVKKTGGDVFSRERDELGRFKKTAQETGDSVENLGRKAKGATPKIAGIGSSTNANTGALSKFNTSIRNAANGLRGFVQTGKGLEFINQQILTLGKHLGVVVLLGAALKGFRDAVNLVKDFGEQLQVLKGVTSGTEEQIESLTQKALELGAKTRFSAVEATKGMEQLARAGFSVNEIYSNTEPVLKFAQAHRIDLATASEIAANATRGLTGDIGRLDEVLDAITTTSNSSSVNVLQLAESLKNSAAIARALNIPLNQTFALLGTLGNAFIKGGKGGNQLKNVLIGLTGSTTTSQKAFQALGIDLDQLDYSNPIANLELLRGKNIDLFAAIQSVGKEGVAALLLLLQETENVKKLADTIDDAAGSTERLANLMDDTLTGSLKEVSSAIQNLVLQFGDQSSLSDVVKDKMFGLAGSIREASTAARIFGGIFGILFVGLNTSVTLLITAMKTALTATVATWTTIIGSAQGVAIKIIEIFQNLPTVDDDFMQGTIDALTNSKEKVDSIAETFWDQSSKNLNAGLVKISQNGEDLKKLMDSMVKTVTDGKAELDPLLQNTPDPGDNSELEKKLTARLNAVKKYLSDLGIELGLTQTEVSKKSQLITDTLETIGGNTQIAILPPEVREKFQEEITQVVASARVLGTGLSEEFIGIAGRFGVLTDGIKIVEDKTKISLDATAVAFDAFGKKVASVVITTKGEVEKLAFVELEEVPGRIKKITNAIGALKPVLTDDVGKKAEELSISLSKLGNKETSVGVATIVEEMVKLSLRLNDLGVEVPGFVKQLATIQEPAGKVLETFTNIDGLSMLQIQDQLANLNERILTIRENADLARSAISSIDSASDSASVGSPS